MRQVGCRADVGLRVASSRLPPYRYAKMACWYPGPWNYNGAPEEPQQPESSHQAAIAEEKPRRRTTKTEAQKDG
jgi:hypothetical protein